jgi:hypothetical protein
MRVALDMVKVELHILMELTMKVSGLKVREKDGESRDTQMGLYTKENGKMISGRD